VQCLHKDEATVTASGRKMAQMLDDVVAQSGAQRIHLIAHSMGNRALIEALQTYLAKREASKRQRIFDQIVFTAPDVDREYFVGALGSLAGAAARVTLYAPTPTLRCSPRRSCTMLRAPDWRGRTSYQWRASTPSICPRYRPTAWAQLFRGQRRCHLRSVPPVLAR